MRHLLAALVLCLFGGCNDFEKPEDVIDLRVLAAVANPPEIFVAAVPITDPEAALEAGRFFDVTANPASSRLEFLVVNPKAPNAPFTWRAEACAWSERWRCDESEAVFDAGSGTANLPGFAFDFSPDFAFLNAALSEDVFRGFGGLYILVSVQIEQAGEPVLTASKMVTYNVPFVPTGEGQDPPPPKTPNKNPTLGLEIDESTDTALTAAPAQTLVIEPIIDLEADLEDYPVATFGSFDDPEPGYRVLTESLAISYFGTGGTWSNVVREVSTEILADDPDVDLGTEWTAPETPGDYVLYFVLRDDRGGQTWLTRQVSVE